MNGVSWYEHYILYQFRFLWRLFFFSSMSKLTQIHMLCGKNCRCHFHHSIFYFQRKLCKTVNFHGISKLIMKQYSRIGEGIFNLCIAVDMICVNGWCMTMKYFDIIKMQSISINSFDEIYFWDVFNSWGCACVRVCAWICNFIKMFIWQRITNCSLSYLQWNDYNSHDGKREKVIRTH